MKLRDLVSQLITEGVSLDDELLLIHPTAGEEMEEFSVNVEDRFSHDTEDTTKVVILDMTGE